MVGFRERRGQSFVKIGPTRLNLIDDPETTRLFEIHIRILIIGIEKYTTLVHHAPSLDLKSCRWIQRMQ